MKPGIAISAVLVVCLILTPLRAADITGKAVDLDGTPITSGLTVTVQSAQGVALNRLPPVINAAAGTYTITVDQALLDGTGSVVVNLTVSAGGRLSAQLNNLAGIRNQTIDVVLPVDQRCSSCCEPRRLFHRRSK